MSSSDPKDIPDVDSLLMPPPVRRPKQRRISHNKNNGSNTTKEDKMTPLSGKMSFPSPDQKNEMGENSALQQLDRVHRQSDIIIPVNHSPFQKHNDECIKLDNNQESDNIVGDNKFHCDQRMELICRSRKNNLSNQFDRPPMRERFSDIIGHGSAKLRLDEMLLPLALPTNLATSILKGIRAAPISVLLYGPPGTGKTKLAKAVAGEAQAAFISVGPSDVLSKFVGESEASIKKLFEEAYEKAKRMESRCTVLFFDEIDALGQSRGDNSGGLGASEQGGGSGGGNNSRRILAELLIQLTKNDSNNDESHESDLESDDNNNSDNNYEDDKSDEETVLHDDAYFNDEDDNERNNINNGPVSSDIIVPNHNEYQMNTNTRILNTTFKSSSSDEDHDSSTNDGIVQHSTTQRLSSSSSQSGCSNSNNNIMIQRFKKRGVRLSRPRVLVVAATNRPEDCDPALLRRFGVRVLVGLPETRDRRRILERLLVGVKHTVSRSQLKDLALSTDGWSGSDLESLAREAVMAPIRECLREAAIMKIRSRKRKKKQQPPRKSNQQLQQQPQSSSSCVMDEDENDADEIEIARDFLLSRLENIRSVTLKDFESAANFWMGGNCQTNQNLGFDAVDSHNSNICHYDTDSSGEEDNDDHLVNIM